MILIFRKNKQYIGIANNLPDVAKDNFLIREVEDKYADITKWRWTGDYDQGYFVPVKNQEVSIPEKDALLFLAIEKEYPLPFIISNIIKQLRYLSKEEIPEFKNMADLILAAVETHQINKNLYHELHGPIH